MMTYWLDPMAISSNWNTVVYSNYGPMREPLDLVPVENPRTRKGLLPHFLIQYQERSFGPRQMSSRDVIPRHSSRGRHRGRRHF